MKLPIVMLVFFMACFQAVVTAAKTIPALIVLDPGHGGEEHGGPNRLGFPMANGKFLAEDGYMYDIAKRIERKISLPKRMVAFTVIDPSFDTALDFNSSMLIPARTDMVYNSGLKNVRVFRSEEGLRNRLEVAHSAVYQHKHLTPLFISLHFDWAYSDLVSGAKIYVPGSKNNRSIIFAEQLRKEFSKAGLGFIVDSKPRSVIGRGGKLIVLKEGKIDPRVLIELGNFKNIADRSRLLSASGRQRYATIIVNAIESYLALPNLDKKTTNSKKVKSRIRRIALDYQ